MNKFEKLLEQSGMTAYEVAKAAKVPTSVTYNLKSGKRKIENLSLETSVALAKAFGISAEDLLNGNVDNVKKPSLRTVIDEFGNEVIINDDLKVLYTYNNSKKELVWSAPIYENGKRTPFSADFIEHDVCNDLELKIKVWNSKLNFAYSQMVGFNASENDPEQTLWKRFVEIVRSNEDKFFDENGDYRKESLVSIADIQEMAKDIQAIEITKEEDQ